MRHNKSSNIKMENIVILWFEYPRVLLNTAKYRTSRGRKNVCLLDTKIKELDY